MHILHVGESSSQGSAPSVHSQEMRRALRQRGHDVEAFDTTLKSRFAPIRLMESFLAAVSLFRFLRSKKFDLVYCRETWLDPFRGLCLEWSGVPWVVEVNGLILHDLQKDGARQWLLSISEWSQGFTLRRATGVFAACSAWAKELKQRYGLARVEILQNGVDLDAFSHGSHPSWRDRLGVQSTDLTLGYLGHLGRYYDFDPMLGCLPDLVKEFPTFRLVFIGSGPGESKLRARVAKLGLEPWVRFHPPVSHDEVPAAIQSFDLGWLPVSAARVRETRGVLHAMKLAEYCASGKPILRTDYVGSDSWEPLSEFSWAVQPDGGNTFEVTKRALLEQQRWPAMSANARKFAQDSLSWEAAVNRLEAFVEQWTQ